MSIEIFEKAVTDHTASGCAEAIANLLKDAGFNDVAYAVGDSDMCTFTSSSGVYGCIKFKANFYFTQFLNQLNKFIAVKDDSRKALIIYSDAPRKDTSGSYDLYFYQFIIVDGVTSSSNHVFFSAATNITGGTFKDPTDVSEALLTPFIDGDAKVLRPFYISANRVLHPINTVVSDGSNSFTSLGNLFYIKNA